jgi:tol-pal system protein YbgF
VITGVLKKVFCLVIASVLSWGCVNQKMMDFTYQQLDTVKTTQRELLDRVDNLSTQMELDRDARVRAEAEYALVLSELREVLEALSYRVEDLPTLLARQRRENPRPAVSAMFDTTMADSAATDSIAPPPPPVETDSEADKLFRGSYMDLTMGNYDLAVQGFKNYLVRFPNEVSGVDAHYYLADSYYQLERFIEAVAEYQIIIREFPNSRFAPPAYLKSGVCYGNLGETQLSERSYRELISRYPRTEEAEQARVALLDIKG